MENHKRRPSQNLKVGDLVLLNRNGINWPADNNKENKLLPRRIGPFKIKTINHKFQNYELMLPSNLKIHPWFHVSILTKYIPSDFNRPVIQEKYPDTHDYEIEKIISHRYFKGKLQYLVSWKGYGPEHNSWEPVQNFNADNLLNSYHKYRGGVVLPALAQRARTPALGPKSGTRRQEVNRPI